MRRGNSGGSEGSKTDFDLRITTSEPIVDCRKLRYKTDSIANYEINVLLRGVWRTAYRPVMHTVLCSWKGNFFLF